MGHQRMKRNNKRGDVEKREKNKINLVYRSLDLKIKKKGKSCGLLSVQVAAGFFLVVCQGMAFVTKYKFKSFSDFESIIMWASLVRFKRSQWKCRVTTDFQELSLYKSEKFYEKSIVGVSTMQSSRDFYATIRKKGF